MYFEKHSRRNNEDFIFEFLTERKLGIGCYYISRSSDNKLKAIIKIFIYKNNFFLNLIYNYSDLTLSSYTTSYINYTTKNSD